MDQMRSGLFTKFARAITMAASSGGGDQTMNFTLRLAVDKAKEINMPKDNIERAIKRGTGELSDGAALEEALYEGFGPGGTAFLVEAVTDNKTRTVSEIKNAFTKNGGTMGGPGSVQWQFKKCGVVRFVKEEQEKIKDKWADFELALMDAGVDDIIDNEFGVEIHCPVANFQKVSETVSSFGIKTEDAGLEWIAKETMSLSEEDGQKVQNLADALETLDDVKAVYYNS